MAAGLSWYARDPIGYLRMASRLVASLPENVVLIEPNTRKILLANPKARELLKLRASEARGRHIDDYIQGLPGTFLDTPASEGAPSRVECRLTGSGLDGQVLRVEWWKVSSFWRDVIVLRMRANVSSDEELAMDESQVSARAQSNPLSWLSQARAKEELKRRMATCAGSSRRLAVLYVDVDHLKLINDTCGYPAGDAVLRQVARRLRETLPTSELVLGLGADEFIGTCYIDDNQSAEKDITRIVRKMRMPITTQGKRFIVTASIGASIFPDDATDPESLLRFADIALYKAKNNGRDNVQFFKPEMREELDERIQMEHALRGAARRGEFSLVYQPIVDMGTSELIGMEALLRWRHPELGEISPAKFIPVAESCGLISENIGAWVIRAVCQQVRQWRAEGRCVVPVNVNISPRQISRGGLAELVEKTLRGAELDPGHLCFEITETALMQNLESNLQELTKLKKMGSRIVVDDFGTGYSSLAYLKNLPIDGLKIDKSFVRDMCADPSDAAIVSAIVGLAEHLELGTVAEGVETAEQAARLAVLGCRSAQGYFYGRPQAAAQAIWRMPLRDPDPSASRRATLAFGPSDPVTAS